MSELRYPHLFSPIKLGSVTIPNRIAMAPMSTQLGSLEGHVTPEQIAFYRSRAEGGTGLIIVEFCCVHRRTGRSEHRQLSLESETHLDGHLRLVDAIKSAGAVPALQLQHGGPGIKRELAENGVAVGPCDVSSRRDPSRLAARGLTDEEIEHLIECFGRTAELGIRAGYEVFELHGAHGYLLTTFMTPLMNKRDDKWGGDEERRLQFPRRVIERVKRAIGNKPLIYRFSADEFSPDGLSIDDTARIAPKLVGAGLDALHVSIGLGSTSFDKIIEPMSAPEGWRLPYARRIREAVDVPVISVGQIRWPATAERAIRDGDADMIALGRPLLADPAWANKAHAGRDKDIRPCTSCNYCVTVSSGEHGKIACAENPRTGRELDALPVRSGACPGRAVVVGGGPGGMAAALMLSQAGYVTELFEARKSLGGGLIASAAPPFKEKLTWYLEYLERQLAASDVVVRLGEFAQFERLVDPSPEIVILANGGRPVRLDIEGIDGPEVVDAYEVLMGDDGWLPEARDLPVVVYGGGETGCETAEYLAERGFEVILVTRSRASQLARSAEMIYRGVLRKRLAESMRIRVVDQAEIVAIAPGLIHLRTLEGEVSVQPCCRVLVAQGRRPDHTLAQQLRAAGVPHYSIGDARRGGRIGDAVHGAYEALRTLQACAMQVRELAC